MLKIAWWRSVIQAASWIADQFIRGTNIQCRTGRVAIVTKEHKMQSTLTAHNFYSASDAKIVSINTCRSDGYLFSVISCLLRESEPRTEQQNEYGFLHTGSPLVNFWCQF